MEFHVYERPIYDRREVCMHVLCKDLAKICTFWPRSNLQQRNYSLSNMLVAKYIFFCGKQHGLNYFHSGLLKRSSFKILYGQDLPCKLSENLWNFVFIKDLWPGRGLYALCHWCCPDLSRILPILMRQLANQIWKVSVIALLYKRKIVFIEHSIFDKVTSRSDFPWTQQKPRSRDGEVSSSFVSDLGGVHCYV